MGSHHSKPSNSPQYSMPRGGHQSPFIYGFVPGGRQNPSPFQRRPSPCRPLLVKDGKVAITLLKSYQKGHSEPEGDYVESIHRFRKDMKAMKKRNREFELQITTAIEHMDMILGWENNPKVAPNSKMVKEQIAHAVKQLEIVKGNLDEKAHPADAKKLGNLIFRLKLEGGLLFDFMDDFVCKLPAGTTIAVVAYEAGVWSSDNQIDQSFGRMNNERYHSIVRVNNDIDPSVGLEKIGKILKLINPKALLEFIHHIPDHLPESLGTITSVVASAVAVFYGLWWLKGVTVTYDTIREKQTETALDDGKNPYEGVIPGLDLGAIIGKGSEQQQDPDPDSDGESKSK